MIDPISLAIGGGTSLISTLMNRSARNRAMGIERDNMLLQMVMQQWQKEQAEKGLNFAKQTQRDAQRFAKAGSTDAFGNRQFFDEALNEWITKLSSDQQQIRDASENEQLLSLTQDARRNRAMREQQNQRALNLQERDDAFARGAAEDYEDTNSAFKFSQPKSEEAIRGEYQSLFQGVSDDNQRNKLGGISTAMLRNGQGAMLPNLIRSSNEDVAGDFSSNLIKARQAALGETGQREQMHTSKFLPALQMYGASRRQAPGQVGFGNVETGRTDALATRLAGSQGNSAGNLIGATTDSGKQLLQAIQQMLQGVGGVENKGAKYAGQSDFNPTHLAQMLNALDGYSPGRRGASSRKPAYDASSIGYNYF